MAIPINFTYYETIASNNATILDILSDKKSYLTVADISTMTAGPDTNQTYINNFVGPLNALETVTEFKVKAYTVGPLTIVRCNADFSGVTDMTTVTLVAGVNTFKVNIPLANGQILGCKYGATGLPVYKSSGGIGMYKVSTGILTAGLEMAYNYTTVIKPVTQAQASAQAASQAVINENIFGQTKYKGLILLTAYTTGSLQTGATGLGYFNNFSTPLTDLEVVKTFSMYSKVNGAGYIIVKSNPSKTVFTDIQTVYTVKGVNVFSVNIPLLSGERLGLRTISTGAVYAGSGGIGEFQTDGAVVAGFEIAYTYESVQTYKGLVELSNIITQTNPYENILFSDNFSNSSQWTSTNWTFASPVFTPTVLGVNNRLNLPKIYHIDKRAMRALITLGADSDLRIHMINPVGGTAGLGQGIGASMFGINAATGKISIYSAVGLNPSYGVSNTPLVETILPTSIVVGRKYLVEIIKDNVTGTLNFTDILTAVKSSVSFEGWEMGMQNDYYGFFVDSGNLSNVSVGEKVDVRCTMQRVENVILGDSITEGLLVSTRSARWASKVRDVVPKTIISARGGASIADTITKLDTEIKYIRPKRLIVLIGANAGLSAPQIQIIVDFCVKYSIALFFNHLTCVSNDYHIAQNALLDTFNLKGAKFDVATASQNFPLIDGSHLSPRTATGLYNGDGLHPNAAGNDAMFNRLALDIPSVLNIN